MYVLTLQFLTSFGMLANSQCCPTIGTHWAPWGPLLGSPKEGALTFFSTPPGGAAAVLLDQSVFSIQLPYLKAVCIQWQSLLAESVPSN